MRGDGNLLKRLLTVGVLLGCGLIGCRSARADSNDRVQFGEKIVVAEGQTAGDAVCFFCSVEVDGELEGDAVVFFGNLTVNGKVDSAVDFGGVTSVGQSGRIESDAVVMGGRLRTASGSSIQGDRVVFPPIIFILPLLFFGSIIAGFYYLLRWLFTRDRPVYVVQGRPMR